MILPESNAQSLSGTRFATIISARSKNFVGVFKVPTACIQPYREQRPLSHTWTQELKQRLEEGVDRAAHPLKVLLDSNSTLPSLEEALKIAGPNKVPWLPQGVKVSVYEGQHRVAACNLLSNRETHWWYAEVYNTGLQDDHPAEVLSMMFLSNEKPVILENNDATRFMTMYRLRELRDKNIITGVTYDANLKRLAHAVENANIRQGLRNIMRSEVLSDAVARTLEKPFLAPCFNGQTWGKKLVKGRFYTLVACFVEEMTRQCMLLQEGSPDVDSKPFELSPQASSWDQLNAASKKNSNHAWKVLAGGIVGAIERVSKRPGDFITPLNPSGSDGWTLRDRVLLPSVLTSTMMENTLAETYQVAQHLIHMIAGPEYLEKYTANIPHTSDDDHPAGIITKVLGRATNVTDRIICHMWHHRELLLKDLDVADISEATSTTSDSYKQLMGHSKEWWTLLRLFKKRCLPTGLIHGLKLPETFEESPNGHLEPLEEESPSRKANGMEKSTGAGTSGLVTPSLITKEPSQHSEVTHRSPGSPARSQHTSSSPSTEVFDMDAQTPEIGGQTAHKGIRPSKRPKRKTVESGADGYMAGTESEQVDPIEPPKKQLRCHGAAISRLQELEAHVPNMQAQEARALDDLLQLLLGLQGSSHSARVFERLSEKIKSLKNRAKKAKTMSQAYDSGAEGDEPEVPPESGVIESGTNAQEGIEEEEEPEQHEGGMNCGIV
ncbi:hypothetical protein FRC11_000696 [Ceratobasidium sp. 423]|nr:hypothetical protein FRC11_000696 [Ceratobasidium sp. 423]